jgi:hypothetical protein
MRSDLVSRVVMQAAAAVVAAALVVQPSTAVASTRVDPGDLPRGEDPAVAHLVGDTIRDGDLRIPATRRGAHDGLWVVRGGYVLRDYNVGPRRLVRVVFISRTGERRLVAQSRNWIGVAVEDSGRVLAVQRNAGGLGEWTRVTVERPRTGRLLASRTLRLSTLVAVTPQRVLLGRRTHWRDPATVWWNFRLDRMHRIQDQAAIRADVRHDKVVFTTSPDNDACVRVAALSKPSRTLWSSCRRGPHQWSPDGTHALSTHTYFDAAGTDKWWVADGSTGDRLARITGRLDWSAVWEDDSHFLTMAQSETGTAAVIRCDLAGSCERASRLWQVPLPPDSTYYAPPPVILAE